MSRSQRTVSLLLLSSLYAAPALGNPAYLTQVPNANRVPGVEGSGCGLCHNSPYGGDARNVFGRTVESSLSRTGVDWPTVCAEDSDGDGFINGVELGDPECAWVDGGLDAMDPLGNPADPNSPGVEVPEAGAEAPEAGAEAPEAGVETPEAGAETPEAGAETPIAGFEPNEGGFEGPEGGEDSELEDEGELLEGEETSGCHASASHSVPALSVLMMFLAFLGLRRLER
jgi:hypothetical protein